MALPGLRVRLSVGLEVIQSLIALAKKHEYNTLKILRQRASTGEERIQGFRPLGDNKDKPP